jgi:hypothetical protein
MTADGDQRPEFESDHYAEWRIRNGDVLVLRYDRTSGIWAGERERLDPDTGGQLGPQTLSPEDVQMLARARDLRLSDGSVPD